jgi:uncharacterized protein
MNKELDLKSVSRRKKPAVFFVLTFSFSSIFYYLIALTGTIAKYSLWIMWCPGISAIITQLVFNKSLHNMGWKICQKKYLFISYLIPMGYGLVVYGIVWLTALGPFNSEGITDQIVNTFTLVNIPPSFITIGYVFVMISLGVIVSFISVLGEEIGWRGLLVPELSKHFSYTVTSLLSGIIWAFWHYPLILFADYNNSGVSSILGLFFFTVVVIGLSFIYAWLRIKTNSLWTAVLLHASNNVYIQAIFTPFTTKTNVTPYIIDEFGMGLPIAICIPAFIFWANPY